MRPLRDPRRGHLLEDHPAQADGEAPIVVGHEADDIPYTISRAVTLRSITRRRGEALMLHAVGVCGPDGATVVLVAPSGTGKTTAANALGKELGYVSDETIVVEDDGRISPYAKPLSIISDPDRRYRKQEHSPDDLGLLQPTPEAPPHLAAMVVLRRDTAATTPEFTSEGLIDAVLMVIPETSALPAMVDPLDRLCRALTQRGGPYKLRYAEIGDCVDLVRALTEADEERDAGAPTWEHHPGADREDPVPGPEDTDNADGATNPTNVGVDLDADSSQLDRLHRLGWRVNPPPRGDTHATESTRHPPVAACRPTHGPASAARSGDRGDR